MKNVIFLLLLFPVFGFTQTNKEIYILLDNNTQIEVEEMGYGITLYVNSNDKRFNTDVYTFHIPTKGFDILPFKDLASPITLSSVEYTKTEDFFKNKTSCEAHENLSLAKIHFIRQIPSGGKNDDQKFRVWDAIYMGTVKNIVKTAKHKSKLLEE